MGQYLIQMSGEVVERHPVFTAGMKGGKRNIDYILYGKGLVLQKVHRFFFSRVLLFPVVGSLVENHGSNKTVEKFRAKQLCFLAYEMGLTLSNIYGSWEDKER